MSTLGPGSVGPVNLASSFAGTQQAKENRDRAKAELAEPAFLVDLKSRADAELDDVAKSGEAEDRDADGRLPYRESLGGRGNGPQNAEDESLTAPARSTDAFDERGRTLDLEA